MHDDELQRLLALATAVVEDAGELARGPLDRSQVEAKAHRNDVVTERDRAVETFIADRLIAETGFPLLGEEAHAASAAEGTVWVLDPIDGTLNFLLTGRDYAISLALCVDGQPVIGVVSDPVRGIVTTAVRGGGVRVDGEPLPPIDAELGLADGFVLTDLKEIAALPRLLDAIRDSRGHRRYGAAALEIVDVAVGRAAAFVHLMLSPWDVAAATLILEEAGGVATRLDGTPMRVWESGSMIAGWPKAHAELVHRMVKAPL